MVGVFGNVHVTTYFLKLLLRQHHEQTDREIVEALQKELESTKKGKVLAEESLLREKEKNSAYQVRERREKICNKRVERQKGKIVASAPFIHPQAEINLLQSEAVNIRKHVERVRSRSPARRSKTPSQSSGIEQPRATKAAYRKKAFPQSEAVALSDIEVLSVAPFAIPFHCITKTARQTDRSIALPQREWLLLGLSRTRWRTEKPLITITIARARTRAGSVGGALEQGIRPQSTYAEQSTLLQKARILAQLFPSPLIFPPPERKGEWKLAIKACGDEMRRRPPATRLPYAPLRASVFPIALASSA